MEIMRQSACLVVNPITVDSYGIFTVGCLRFVIVVFPDHTHLLFFMCMIKPNLYS